MVSFPAYAPSSACCYSTGLLFTAIVPLERMKLGCSKGWLHSWWVVALANFMPSGTSRCCSEGEQKATHSAADCWGLLMELQPGLCYVAGAETCSVPNPARCHFSHCSHPALCPDHVSFLCHYRSLLLTDSVWGFGQCWFFPVLAYANKLLVCCFFNLR